MTLHQRQQHAHMVECAQLAKSGAGHTPETRRAFREAVIRQAFRDDAQRASRDLFAEIQSDNRPEWAN